MLKLKCGANALICARDKLSAKLQKNACEKIVGLLLPAVFVCLTDEEISHSVSFHNFPFLLG